MALQELNRQLAENEAFELSDASIAQLNNVLLDSFAPANVRWEVLAVLQSQPTEKNHKTIDQLIDRVDLEGSKLQIKAEELKLAAGR